MDRLPVQSSNVASIGYDPAGLVLEVEFKDGNVYRYAGVSPNAYAALMAAKSIGSHLHSHFIDGTYPATRAGIKAGHPIRQERAEQVARVIEQMIAAHIARYVHQSTTDEPLHALHDELVAALVPLIR